MQERIDAIIKEILGDMNSRILAGEPLAYSEEQLEFFANPIRTVANILGISIADMEENYIVYTKEELNSLFN